MLKCMVVAVWFVMLAILPMNAQEDGKPDKPTYKAGILGLFEWLPDSTGLKIENRQLEGPAAWYLYSPESQTLSSYNPSLPYDIVEIVADYPTLPLVLYDFIEHTALVSMSLNERFAVYVVDVGDKDYRVALIDLVTGEANIMESLETRYGHYSDAFQIHWSDNSSAFYVRLDYGPVLVHYYVTGFDESIDKAAVLPLSDHDTAENGGFHQLTNGYIHKVYDIDSSGQFLLVQGFVSDSRQTEPVEGVVILNMVTFEGEKVDQSSYTDVNFTDDLKVSYIGLKGVFEYDRIFKRTHLRNTGVNANWASQAAFSPDGRYVAVSSWNYSNELYVIKIDPDSAPETATSTPIP